MVHQAACYWQVCSGQGVSIETSLNLCVLKTQAAEGGHDHGQLSAFKLGPEHLSIVIRLANVLHCIERLSPFIQGAPDLMSNLLSSCLVQGWPESQAPALRPTQRRRLLSTTLVNDARENEPT